MITVAHIKALRRIVAPYFYDIATIYAPPDPLTVTRRPSGAPLNTYPTYWIATIGVMCRIVESRMLGFEKLTAGKPQSTSFLRVSFPHDIVIDETYRFRITASKFNPHLIGVDFDILEVPPGSFNIYRRILATRTTG